MLCEGDKAASILCDRPLDGSRRAVAPARPARTLSFRNECYVEDRRGRKDKEAFESIHTTHYTLHTTSQVLCKYIFKHIQSHTMILELEVDGCHTLS